MKRANLEVRAKVVSFFPWPRFPKYRLSRLFRLPPKKHFTEGNVPVFIKLLKLKYFGSILVRFINSFVKSWALLWTVVLKTEYWCLAELFFKREQNPLLGRAVSFSSFFHDYMMIRYDYYLIFFKQNHIVIVHLVSH
jgi:hypothetical protein